MPDESVHCVVTSPPYWGLRDYGNEPQIWDSEPPEICEGGRDHVWGDDISTGSKVHPGDKSTLVGTQTAEISKSAQSQGQFCQQCGAWRGSLGLEPTPELFIKHMVEIFREVKRVLRSDGTIWVNMGDSYATHGGCKGSKHKHNFRSPEVAEKEGIYRKKPYGKQIGLKEKDLCGIPWMLAFALRADGWYLRSDIIWAKSNPMPEPCKDRPTKSHEYLFLLTKSAKYFYDCDAIREPHIAGTHSRGGIKKDGTGLVKSDEWNKLPPTEHPEGRNKRTVWTIPTQAQPKAHFATFPMKLIEPCILAGTSEKGCCVECGAPWERVVEISKEYHRKPGYKSNSLMAQNKDSMTNFYPDMYNSISKTIGWQDTCSCIRENTFAAAPGLVPCTVLDPFFGSGTTAIVAHKHGRKFVGIELSKTYLDDIAIPRIKRATRQIKIPGF